MAYYDIGEAQKLAAENKEFVMGERDEARKAQRLFDFCLSELERIGDSCNKQVRFLVIEHQCRFTNIDPVRMAAILKQKGYTLVFDDASIPHSENVQKYKRVERYFETMGNEDEHIPKERES